jgi:anhydro-N-acetylmuramic acid kinase
MSKTFTALGLMSGTSLDGIDLAMIRTDGENIVERGPSETFPYSASQQTALRQALRDAEAITHRTQRPGGLQRVEKELTEWHVKAVHKFLHVCALSSSNIDVIGFHGQSIIHRPDQHLTVQLGDGDALAKTLGIAVVYDMRADDVASGGQGAPLVPAYHRALTKNAPIAFVNIGGVANVTYVSANGELLAFDTGPGNALINDWMHQSNGQSYDAGGSTALNGTASQEHVKSALQLPHFQQHPPKSLDRNSFADFSVKGLSFEDGAATLTAFTVQSIRKAAEWFPTPVNRWIICGGGRHNAAIMNGLKSELENVESAEQAGFNGDSMEAEAWAYLAVRSLRGLPLTYPGTTGVIQPLTGGILATPNN